MTRALKLGCSFGLRETLFELPTEDSLPSLPVSLGLVKAVAQGFANYLVSSRFCNIARICVAALADDQMLSIGRALKFSRQIQAP